MDIRNEKVTLIGEILNDEHEISLLELCSACHLSTRLVLEYVDYGVIEPVRGSGANSFFHSHCISRVLTARRLQVDLGVNDAGVALAIDLLDELNELRVGRFSCYEFG